MQESSQRWCDGWQAACIKFKDAINDQLQKTNDQESQHALNELFSHVRQLEKDVMSELPTFITIK